MRYCGPMRYAMQFPAHRLGGQMELCVIRGYALSEVCVMRGFDCSRNYISFVKWQSCRFSTGYVGCDDRKKKERIEDTHKKPR